MDRNTIRLRVVIIRTWFELWASPPNSMAPEDSRTGLSCDVSLVKTGKTIKLSPSLEGVLKERIRRSKERQTRYSMVRDKTLLCDVTASRQSALVQRWKRPGIQDEWDVHVRGGQSIRIEPEGEAVLECWQPISLGVHHAPHISSLQLPHRCWAHWGKRCKWKHVITAMRCGD